MCHIHVEYDIIYTERKTLYYILSVGHINAQKVLENYSSN